MLLALVIFTSIHALSRPLAPSPSRRTPGILEVEHLIGLSAQRQGLGVQRLGELELAAVLAAVDHEEPGAEVEALDTARVLDQPVE
jgi:hypothetical protein